MLGVLALLGAGVYVASQSVYFIGTNSRGLVTLFSGFPYELPGGVKLYSKDFVSGVSASTLSAAAAPDAARPFAALGRRRDRADPQPRTGAAPNDARVAAMNRPIVRLYGLVVLLFALLVAFTSRWTIFEASSLRSNPLNKRALLEQERIARGRILAANGAVLARSVRGAEGTYERELSAGAKSSRMRSATPTPTSARPGLERYRNAALNGQTGTNLQTILDQLQGKRPQGDEVLTTLDPKAQQTAIAALGEHHGAVVALDPRDGAVKVMASTPSFDPNKLPSPAAYERLTHRHAGKRRWSTAPSSSAMPRARPSRW